MMIDSIKELIFKASEAYFGDIRNEWVLKWPGQVVSCVASVSKFNRLKFHGNLNLNFLDELDSRSRRRN